MQPRGRACPELAKGFLAALDSEVLVRKRPVTHHFTQAQAAASRGFCVSAQPSAPELCA